LVISVLFLLKSAFYRMEIDAVSPFNCKGARKRSLLPTLRDDQSLMEPHWIGLAAKHHFLSRISFYSSKVRIFLLVTAANSAIVRQPAQLQLSSTTARRIGSGVGGGESTVDAAPPSLRRQ